jgi:phosphatidylserine/phosphatidylglycerophosphate/cardiolipin synthase-like enzyme
MHYRLALALALTWLCLACAGCSTLSPKDSAEATRILAEGKSTALTCEREDHCAIENRLSRAADSAIASSTAEAPKHAVWIVESGQEALHSRVSMIRAAQHSIDLQTYIFDEDDSARMIMRELIAAAKRGVKVRILIDQLSAFKSARTQVAVAGAHQNLDLKIYNPLFERGSLSNPLQYALASIAQFRTLNQRMHTKLLIVDDKLGLTGGRNYQDDYFDWSPSFNFLDRDILVAGPVVRRMSETFNVFWHSSRAKAMPELKDAVSLLQTQGVPKLSDAAYEFPDRVRAFQTASADVAALDDMYARMEIDTGDVQFIADLPAKHRRGPSAVRKQDPFSSELSQVIASTQSEIILQTPYLVLTNAAQRSFVALQDRAEPPRVIVSSNSLASTDNMLTYGMAYKYRRRYMRRLGFEMFELKPHPASVAFDVVAARSEKDSHVAIHAKSIVVDRTIAVVGTHNFDPRSQHYNTEAAVIVRDPKVAERVAHNMLRMMQPDNAWTIAPNRKALRKVDEAVLSGTEALPILDLWPSRYGTSYQFVPGPACPAPVSFKSPDFQKCYRLVGDFPEVNVVSLRWWLTRVITAMGAVTMPFL